MTTAAGNQAGQVSRHGHISLVKGRSGAAETRSETNPMQSGDATCHAMPQQGESASRRSLGFERIAPPAPHRQRG